MSEALSFDRDQLRDYGLDSSQYWDVIIVGGGATGLGTAVDSAARGYKTLLIEQHDFGKGTSSRSTKLVHGGVRYLRQGNISLVLEALRERGRLVHNAPHLVRRVPFVIPCYKSWERSYYGLGLKLYQAMSGRWALGPSDRLGLDETVEALPNVAASALRGGVRYYDGQFDDSRLIVNLAQSCADLGGVPLNYVRAVGLRRKGDRTCGVLARDLENNIEVELNARVVVNATGVFADSLRKLDDDRAVDMIQPSQGVHVVLDRSFLPGDAALMIPKTDDGRVLFAIPWNGCVVFGTTDTAVDNIALEPVPLDTEVDYLLEHAARHLDRSPGRNDVLSVFAGLRPLVVSGKSDDTKAISRDHVLRVSRSGLVTITGGKWTTYRKMAEDAIDHAARVADLDHRKSPTQTMRIHGWLKDIDPLEPLATYGSDGPAVQNTIEESPDGRELLHPDLPYRKGEVHWAVRSEMARTVEDVLSRRTRSLLLNARASIESAPIVAQIMAREMGHDSKWEREQVASFLSVARGYLPTGADESQIPTAKGHIRRGHYDTA